MLEPEDATAGDVVGRGAGAGVTRTLGGIVLHFGPLACFVIGWLVAGPV